MKISGQLHHMVKWCMKAINNKFKRKCLEKFYLTNIGEFAVSMYSHSNKRRITEKLTRQKSLLTSYNRIDDKCVIHI